MPIPKQPKLSPEEQHTKFIETARHLGTDDDPERFKEVVRKLAKAPAARNISPKRNKAEK